MKRILIYVHYNKYEKLSDHVIYQLQALNHIFERIVFISNSRVGVTDRERLGSYINDFIQRENKGFDFGAWRDGLTYIEFKNLKEYSSVTLMNDTCFGPLYEMETYYKKYEDLQTDIWGITNHRAYEVSKNRFLEEHVQSYFKVFGNKIIRSKHFEDFWRSVQDLERIQDVIDTYEVMSTVFFVKKGFTSEVILDTTKLDASKLPHPDFSYYTPEVILQNNIPFIKVKIFQNCEGKRIGKYIIDWIKENSEYPIDKIIYHLSIMGKPDEKFLIANKYIKDISYQKIDFKVAIHIHVFYPKLLCVFLQELDKFKFDFDLFITTNTVEKEEEIKKKIQEIQFPVTVIRTENYGRDIVPFLRLKDLLISYDIVGHFHTKASEDATFFAGESWRNELVNMMVKPADNIINNFHHNSNLGIVIADIPTFFRINKIVDADNENYMIAPYMNDIWKRMKMQRQVNFHEMVPYTMSYGTFFWARTDALTPLFNLKIDRSEIPDEPLPQNTLLHAIERILIYIAWDKDYDFAISENKEKISPFVDNQTFNKGFYITHENIKNMRLKFLISITSRKLFRFIKYRMYKILKKDLKNVD